MKNKKLRYILVPAVVIVWGLVLYNFFNYSSDSPNYNFDATSMDGEDETIVTTDTFSLIADYRDPFLGRQSSFQTYVPINVENDNTNPVNNVKKAQDNNKPQQVRTIKWPQVNYGGLVTNQQSAKKVGIMQINGKKYLIEESRVYDNLQVLMLSDDSVRVSYLDNYKTFYK